MSYASTTNVLSNRVAPVAGPIINYADMTSAGVYIQVPPANVIVPFAPPSSFATYKTNSGQWSGGRWTCPIKGVWKISCTIHLYNNSNTSAQINSYTQVFNNNASVGPQIPQAIPPYTGDATVSFVELIPLNAGDVVDVRCLAYPQTPNIFLGDGVGRLCCCLLEFLAS